MSLRNSWTMEKNCPGKLKRRRFRPATGAVPMADWRGADGRPARCGWPIGLGFRAIRRHIAHRVGSHDAVDQAGNRPDVRRRLPADRYGTGNNPSRESDTPDGRFRRCSSVYEKFDRFTLKPVSYGYGRRLYFLHAQAKR